MMKNSFEKSKKRTFGVGFFVIWGLLLLSTVLYFIFRLSPDFSDFFNLTVSRILRIVLAGISGIFGFSVAEILVLLIIPFSVFLAVYTVKRDCDSWKSVFVFLFKAASVVSLLWVLFVFVFSAGYFTHGIDEKLGLERKKLSKEDLEKTALILRDNVNLLCDSVEFEEKSFSVMPYSLGELSKKLCAAYDVVSDDCPFIENFESVAKPVLLSELMSYTHITGVYSYITGESNVNVAFPDYTIPYTAAHELAHQRGIAREDEANFVAYLVCISSDDEYIRYSGYLGMFEYFASAYYSADSSENHSDYYALFKGLDERAIYEIVAYADFFGKYEDNVVADVSGTFNDLSLKANGTEGEKSYGLVIELCAAYYAR